MTGARTNGAHGSSAQVNGSRRTGLAALLAPRSVAVLGASDDPRAFGGRPLRYLRDAGFAGSVHPVHAGSDRVQGLPAYPSVAALPDVPDVALLTVPGPDLPDAVAECAAAGVPAGIVFASGLGEVDDRAGGALHRRMLEAAAVGMRLVGPNAQAIANYATGAVLTPWGVSDEEPPADGPVALISQSGAMVSMIYGVLRRRGVGVRHAHGIGGALDVSVAELTAAVLTDPGVRLVLLYLEDLSDPAALERAASVAAAREVPVVALTGARSAAGKRAALSHSGALATENRVVDAFFRRIGVRRVTSGAELVAATELYLDGPVPRGRRLAVVSNSGAACVLGADAASDHGLPLARLAPETGERLHELLPPVTMRDNPIDVMGLPMADPGLLAKVLAPLATDPGVDACLLALPVAGPAYDVARFVADAAGHATTSGIPLLAAVPQPDIRTRFRRAGVPAFADEAAAVAALAAVLDHRAAMAAARGRPLRLAVPAPGATRALDEHESLELLAALGVSVVDRAVCADAAAAGRAFDEFGGPVVVKGLSAKVTHKSELGLVRLGVRTRADAERAATAILAAMREHGLAPRLLVSPQVAGVREVLLGAHVDPTFGPVVVVGDGGRHVEALPDVALLLPPFTPDEAEAAIRGLRCAPLFDGVRGEPAVDVSGWADAAVRVGTALLAPGSRLRGLDANPLLLGGAAGRGVAVDAVAITAPS